MHLESWRRMTPNRSSPKEPPQLFSNESGEENNIPFVFSKFYVHNIQNLSLSNASHNKKKNWGLDAQHFFLMVQPLKGRSGTEGTRNSGSLKVSI